MTSTIFSGIKPSGDMTLGNYLGAIKNHVQMANEANANTTFCVVDLHAVTVRQDPDLLRERTYNVAAWYLAAGLDPLQSTLFVQSHVRAHTELAWLLNCFSYMGELERMTQFKEKAQQQKDNLNAGLFTYPVLMAADVLLYDTTHVPVGEDQKQHIELARNIAQRFNGVYGDVFTVPEPVIGEVAARVMDLQNPTSKMGKSHEAAGTVYLAEEDKKTEKKFKRAVTDNVAAVNWDKENQPGVTNLLSIYSAIKNIKPTEAVSQFDGKGYGDLKKTVAEAVLAEIAPVRDRYLELMNDKAELERVFEMGAEKAEEQADKKLAEVKEAMGFVLGR